MKRAVYSLWQAKTKYQWDEPKFDPEHPENRLYGAVDVKTDIPAEMFYRIILDNHKAFENKKFNRISASIISQSGVCFFVTIEPQNIDTYLRQYREIKKKRDQGIPF